MGRKTYTPEERLALAQKRGFAAETTSDRQDQLSKVEQLSLAGATEKRHQDRFAYKDTRYHAVKGLKMEVSRRPDTATFKDFMEYYASSRDGLIDELPTMHSVLNMWYKFVGYLNRITKSKLDRQVCSDVAAFISGSLRQKLNLSTKKRDKYLVTQKDLTRLLEYLWCSDDHEYLHERLRVQLTFCLIIFAACGARAGAIVESSSYKGSNEALTYKDCHIHLVRRLGGGFEFHLEIIQRFVKGKRGDENDNLHIIITPKDRLLYNGFWVLASLAIADNAIKGFKTLDDLEKARVPDGRDSWELEWEEDARDLPILRMATAEGVHKYRALTYAALWNQIVSLGIRAGYRDSVKIHAIRAGVANKIKDPEKRKQTLGHGDHVIYYKSYASKIVEVDGLSEYLGDAPSTEHIEQLRSMDHRRDKNAPRKLPAAEKVEFDRSPKIREVNMRIEKITRDIAGKPAEHPALFKERQKLYGEKRQQLRLAERLSREKWFNTSYDVEALRQLQTEEIDAKALAKPRQISTFYLTRRLMPARDRVANVILLTPDLRSDKYRAAQRDIYSLCIDDSRVAYRPNEHPIDGACPREGCSTAMIELPVAMRSRHIHACRQRELRDTLSQQPSSYSRRLRNRKLPFAEYCYACCEWSCSEDSWNSHCRSHLERLELRCGLLSFRYTLVVAGYCPFCLGDEGLSPSQRMRQWMTKPTLLNHIDIHLTTYTGLECPHPICHVSLERPSDFTAHFEDVHIIGEPRSNCVSRNRRRDDEKEEIQGMNGEATDHMTRKLVVIGGTPHFMAQMASAEWLQSIPTPASGAKVLRLYTFTMSCPRTSNQERARRRTECRKKLSEHIHSRLGIAVLPANVKLMTKSEDPYQWNIFSTDKTALFDKQLSKHSTGAYIDLCNGVGVHFEAVLSEGAANHEQTGRPIITGAIPNGKGNSNHLSRDIDKVHVAAEEWRERYKAELARRESLEVELAAVKSENTELLNEIKALREVEVTRTLDLDKTKEILSRLSHMLQDRASKAYEDLQQVTRVAEYLHLGSKPLVTMQGHLATG
ncbi:Uncharacterized protein BP5553_09747 [Venustampulla echinocandica]|uniref:C2H2-type domain-containing protein n=1 Tax=Venustampulla echinocandica TaxID=2656787 RepID=A0A370TBV2_9HELO|nr:Uncharacterized protein BP5553_09747 [Venustampulla echinocandica]RDL31538.1 Uncharacterized protein BP5553_09747 [Venustampulla echinocandica]